MPLVPDIFSHRIDLKGGGHLDVRIKHLPRVKKIVRRKYEARSLGRFVKAGNLNLYHYSPTSGDEIEVDPSHFGKNPWSKNEKQAAQTPRSYFYTDLADREDYFKGRPLFKTSLLADQVYDLTTDTLRLKGEGNSIDDIIDQVRKKGFKGIYYDNGMPLVALLEKVKAHRVDEDEVARKDFGKTVEELKTGRRQAREKQLAEEQARMEAIAAQIAAMRAKKKAATK